MTAVVGGDPEVVVAAPRGTGPDGRQPQRRRPGRRRRHRADLDRARRGPACRRSGPAAGRGRRLPHPSHGARPPGGSAAVAAGIRPGTPQVGPALQRRRHARHRRRGAGTAAGGAGRQHRSGGISAWRRCEDPRRHGGRRDGARRHPDRHRQARAQGRRDVRPEYRRCTLPGGFRAKHGEVLFLGVGIGTSHLLDLAAAKGMLRYSSRRPRASTHPPRTAIGEYRPEPAPLHHGGRR